MNALLSPYVASRSSLNPLLLPSAYQNILLSQFPALNVTRCCKRICSEFPPIGIDASGDADEVTFADFAINHRACEATAIDFFEKRYHRL